VLRWGKGEGKGGGKGKRRQFHFLFHLLRNKKESTLVWFPLLEMKGEKKGGVPGVACWMKRVWLFGARLFRHPGTRREEECGLRMGVSVIQIRLFPPKQMKKKSGKEKGEFRKLCT